MSRVHDALRKEALETGERPGISEISDGDTEHDLSKGFGVVLSPNAGPPSNSGGLRPVEEEMLGREDGMRSGEEASVAHQFGGDPLLRDRERSVLDLSERAQEQVVKLVQRVFVSANFGSPRVVVFSSVEGSGSSEICLRSGEALARRVSGSVCLVDANLRSPLLHKLSGVARSPGLAEALIDSGPIKDFVARIARGNVWVMPPGSRAEDAPESLATGRFRSRLLELKKEFDYVLIDAPPIASNGEASLLGQMSDGVILVVEANSTRHETARRAKETFEAADVNLLGAVLNNRTFPIPEPLYRKL